MMDSSSASNASLLSLSPELWPGILQFLSRTELCALCLVCKDVKTVAEPILYGSIDLEWQWPPRQDQRNASPLFYVVCTLRRRPDLGALIKEVKLRGCRKPGHVDATPKPDPSQVEDAMALIQPTNLPSQDVFAQELSGGNMDAWGAVLLSQLSSIRVIHVERHFATFSLMGLVLRTSILGNPDRHGLPSFSYLEDVSWDTMFHWKLNSRDEPPTGDALLLFFLPAIRQLSLTITSPAQFSWPTHHQPTPSMLTRLHLEYIREGLLGNIIAVTSNLQSLRWLWYYREDLRWRSEYVRDVIDLDQIAKDLSHVKNTLSELVITAACEMHCSMPAPPPLTHSGSLLELSSFTALKTMQAPLPFFLGLSPRNSPPLMMVLPPKLESLCIADDLCAQEENAWESDSLLANFLPTLQSWLPVIKANNPSLRCFRYLMNNDEHRSSAEEETFYEFCKNVGLDSRFG